MFTLNESVLICGQKKVDKILWKSVHGIKEKMIRRLTFADPSAN